MPSAFCYMNTDYTRVQVGDKVRDNQTLEEGQVIDIRSGGDWLTLIVVAVAGSSMYKTYQVTNPALPGSNGKSCVDIAGSNLVKRDLSSSAAKASSRIGKQVVLTPSKINTMPAGVDKLTAYIDYTYGAKIDIADKDKVIKLLHEALDGKPTDFWRDLDDIQALVTSTGSGKYEDAVVKQASILTRRHAAMLRRFVVVGSIDDLNAEVKVPGIGSVDVRARRIELLAKRSNTLSKLSDAQSIGDEASTAAHSYNLKKIDRELGKLESAEVHSRVSTIFGKNSAYSKLDRQRNQLKRQYLAEHAKSQRLNVLDDIGNRLSSIEQQMYQELASERSRAVFLVSDEYERLGIRGHTTKSAVAIANEQLYNIRRASRTLSYNAKKVMWQHGITQEMEDALSIAERHGGHNQAHAVRKALRQGDYATASGQIELLGKELPTMRGRFTEGARVVKTYGHVQEQLQRLRIAAASTKNKAQQLRREAVAARSGLLDTERFRLSTERGYRFKLHKEARSEAAKNFWFGLEKEADMVGGIDIGDYYGPLDVQGMADEAADALDLETRRLSAELAESAFGSQNFGARQLTRRQQSLVKAHIRWSGKNPVSGRRILPHSAKTVLEHGGGLHVSHHGVRFNVSDYVEDDKGSVRFIATPENTVSASDLEMVTRFRTHAQGDVTEAFLQDAYYQLGSADSTSLLAGELRNKPISVGRFNTSGLSMEDLIKQAADPSISFSQSKKFSPINVLVNNVINGESVSSTKRVASAEELISYAFSGHAGVKQDPVGFLRNYLEESLIHNGSFVGLAADTREAAADISGKMAEDIISTLAQVKTTETLGAESIVKSAIARQMKYGKFKQYASELGLGRTVNGVEQESLADLIMRVGTEGSAYERELSASGAIDTVGEHFFGEHVMPNGMRVEVSEQDELLGTHLKTFTRLQKEGRLRVFSEGGQVRIRFLDTEQTQAHSLADVKKIEARLSTARKDMAYAVQSGNTREASSLSALVNKLSKQLDEATSGKSSVTNITKSAAETMSDWENVVEEVRATNNPGLMDLFGIEAFKADGNIYEDATIYHVPSGITGHRAGHGFVVDALGTGYSIEGTAMLPGTDVPADLAGRLKEGQVVLPFESLAKEQYGVNNAQFIRHHYNVSASSNMYRLADGGFISSREPTAEDFRKHIDNIKKLTSADRSARKVYMLDLEWKTQAAGGGISEVGLSEYKNTSKNMQLVRDFSEDITLTKAGATKLAAIETSDVQGYLRKQGVAEADLTKATYDELARRTEDVLGESTRTESAMIKRTARLLRDNPDALILTQNKTADLPKLFERATLIGDKASAKIFNEALSRNADVMLVAQLFDAKLAGGHNLENLAKVSGMLTEGLPQAHRNIISSAERGLGVKSDIDLTAGVANYFIHGTASTKTKAALKGLSQEPFTVGDNSYVWRSQGPAGERRRAYKVLGFTRVGEGAEQNSAVAMQEVIDFADGVPVLGDVEYKSRIAEKELGPWFAGEFAPINDLEELNKLRQHTIEDLAGRRVRQAMSDPDYAFDELWRLDLAKRARTTGKASALAPDISKLTDQIHDEDILSDRYLQLRSEWARQQSYAWDYLSDPRLQQQLADKEASWLEGEFTNLHRPFYEELRNRQDLSYADRQQILRLWHAKVDDVAGVQIAANEIPMYERQLSFQSDVLGKHPVGMSIYSRDAWEASKLRHSDAIASNFGRGRLSEALGDLTDTENLEAFMNAEPGRKMAALSEAGRERVRQSVWNKELSNALRSNLSPHAAKMLGGDTLPLGPDELEEALLTFGKGEHVTTEQLASITGADARNYLQNRWDVISQNENALADIKTYGKQLLDQQREAVTESENAMSAYSYRSSQITQDLFAKNTSSGELPGIPMLSAGTKQTYETMEEKAARRVANAVNLSEVEDVPIPYGRYKDRLLGEVGRPALEELATSSDLSIGFRQGIKKVLAAAGPEYVPPVLRNISTRQESLGRVLDIAQESFGKALENRTVKTVVVAAAAAGALFLSRKPNLESAEEKITPQESYAQHIHKDEHPIYHRIVAAIHGESSGNSTDNIAESIRNALAAHVAGGVEQPNQNVTDNRTSFGRLALDSLSRKIDGFGSLLEN